MALQIQQPAFTHPTAIRHKNDHNMIIIIIPLLHVADTEAIGHINHKKIRIHNYAKIQHVLKY